jgi:hypothetical protein
MHFLTQRGDILPHCSCEVAWWLLSIRIEASRQTNVYLCAIRKWIKTYIFITNASTEKWLFCPARNSLYLYGIMSPDLLPNVINLKVFFVPCVSLLPCCLDFQKSRGRHFQAFLTTARDVGEVSVTFLFWPLHSWIKGHRHPIDARLGGPRVELEALTVYWKGTRLFPPCIDLEFSSPSTHS